MILNIENELVSINSYESKIKDSQILKMNLTNLNQLSDKKEYKNNQFHKLNEKLEFLRQNLESINERLDLINVFLNIIKGKLQFKKR